MPCIQNEGEVTEKVGNPLIRFSPDYRLLKPSYATANAQASNLTAPGLRLMHITGLVHLLNMF
jgi:hypothetical protein